MLIIVTKQFTKRRELKGMEPNSFRPTRKSLVSAIKCNKQLQFAKQNKYWTVEQWGMSYSLMSQNSAHTRTMDTPRLEGNLTKRWILHAECPLCRSMEAVL
ncbi:hypothetical protein AVEN_225915-1 [Araneus ventricosus]|uniref:Transposase Tc1-like domain-containing protein n=1 Tax=Araneus ventricosus TaxID=182803 RepID=A0A4Y2BE55_ARAVE|nr:hypothetical protein AVEN_225915-1 [Araneus ventricosus]